MRVLNLTLPSICRFEVEEMSEEVMHLAHVQKTNAVLYLPCIKMSNHTMSRKIEHKRFSKFKPVYAVC